MRAFDPFRWRAHGWYESGPTGPAKPGVEGREVC